MKYIGNRKYKFLKLASSSLLCLCAMTQLAAAQEQLVTVGPGTRFSESWRMNPTGTHAVGEEEDAIDPATTRAYVYSNGVRTILSSPGEVAKAKFVSNDGTIIAGEGTVGVWGTQTKVFVWTNGVRSEIEAAPGDDTYLEGMTTGGDVLLLKSYDTVAGINIFHVWENNVLTTLNNGPLESIVTKLSGNGNVVIGHDWNDVGGKSRAFHWENGITTYIGTLGGNESFARDVSDDGTVIVGGSYVTFGSQYTAFRWDSVNNMQPLGTLGGDSSEANFITADKTKIFGTSEAQIGDQTRHLFRWENGSMTDLGTLNDDTMYIFDITSTGSALAGLSYNNTTFIATQFKWVDGVGLKSIADILTDSNVDISQWTFNTSSQMTLSDDGSVLFGTGVYNGTSTAYIMTSSGITTPGDVIDTVSTTTQMRQQSQGVVQGLMGQSLLASRQAMRLVPAVPAASRTQRETGLSSGSDYYFGPRRYAAYTTGSFGMGQNNDFSNHAANGTTGIFAKATDDLAIGIGLALGSSQNETLYDGETQITSYGGVVNVAYEPDNGLRLYGSASLMQLDLDIDRHYVNGGGISRSSGESDGIGIGAAVQLGYEMPVHDKTSIMPFGGIEVSRTSIDGFLEKGGPFPARFSEQSATTISSSLGAELKHDFTPDLQLKTRASWGHQIKSDSNDASAVIIGTNFALPYSKGDRDWVDIGATADWKISDRTTFMTDISGRAGKTATPAAAITVGISYAF